MAKFVLTSEFKIMDVKEVKLELMQYLLQTESEEVLAKLQSIFKQSETFELSTQQKEILDTRKQRHLNGDGQSFSWDEAKNKVRKSAG